jgi:AcrR family transcriptional regulator
VLAAIDSFVSVGYEASNLDVIAGDAGSTKPTLYRLFTSKERLFLEAISLALANSRAEMPALVDDDRDALAILTDAAHAMVKSFRDNQIGPLWRTINAVQIKFPGLYEEVQAIITSGTAGTLLADYFQRAKASGVMKIEHPQLAAHQFTVLLGPGLDLLVDETHRTYSDNAWISSAAAMIHALYFIEPARDPASGC